MSLHRDKRLTARLRASELLHPGEINKIDPSIVAIMRLGEGVVRRLSRSDEVEFAPLQIEFRLTNHMPWMLCG